MVKFVVTCRITWNPVSSDVSVPKFSVWGLDEALDGSPEPRVLPGTLQTLGKSLLNEWTSLGLSFLQSEGRDESRLHLSLLSAPMLYDSDLITNTEQLRRNGTTACHWRDGSIYEWTFSNGVSIFKKSLSLLFLLTKVNACSLDTLSSLVYNISDEFLCMYRHTSFYCSLLYCASKVLHVLQIEGLWQLHVVRW